MDTQAATTQRAEAVFAQRYSKLNQAQRQAVETIDGVVMVVAGPGTGKTELLALRAANIVRTTQLDPWNVLCLTFTESGVKALRERMVAIMGPAGYQVRVHTFHSFCSRVLQEFPEAFPFMSYGEPLSDVERVALLEKLLAELPATSPLKPFGNPHLFLKDIVTAIQQLKQEHIEPDTLRKILVDSDKLLKQILPSLDTFAALKPKERTEAVCAEVLTDIVSHKKQFTRLSFQFALISEYERKWRERSGEVADERSLSRLRTQLKNDLVGWARRASQQLKRQRDVVRSYTKYQEALAQQGRFDFEDMITRTIAAFETNDDVLAHYQESFQYVLVDEYQDTNGSQNELLFKLTEHIDEPNMCVVGDDQQAIYRFQGASLENMLTLADRYPGLTTISLTENYRSQQTVLDAATDFVAHNEASLAEQLPNIGRELSAQPGRQAQPLEVWQCATAASEDVHVVAELEKELKKGVPAAEIAVLTRRNREASELAETLRRAGLPVQLVTDERLFEVPAVQQFVALLRYVEAGEEALLHQLIHIPWLVPDALDAMQAQVGARTARRPLHLFLLDEAALTAAGVVDTKRLQALVKSCARWQQIAATHPLPDTVATILAESKFLMHLIDQKDDADSIRFVRALFEEARRVHRRDSSSRLSSFLNHLTFIQSHDLTIPVSKGAEREAIAVMTAHRAKGLEFTSVYLPRTQDTIWGNMRTSHGVVLPHGLVAHEYVTLDRNEDERRLFYVALTRAKQRVVISYSDANHDGRPLTPSVFISELPTAHVSSKQAASVSSTEMAQKLLKPLPVRSRTELEEFSRGLLTGYRMSVTHLNNYLRCPRLFFFRNLLREPAIKTKHMAFGTAVHAALRDMFATFDEWSIKTRLSYLLTQFDSQLDRELLPDEVASETKEFGREVLKRYYEKYGQSWNGAVLTEYDFRTHGVQVAGVQLTGLLDKIELGGKESDEVVVVDYKTGQPDNKGKELKPGGEYWRQLVFYQLLCDASDQFPYQMVAGEIDFVQPNRRGAFVKKRFEITDEEKDTVRGEIASTWEAMQQLSFLDEAHQCGECEYCS